MSKKAFLLLLLSIAVVASCPGCATVPPSPVLSVFERTHVNAHTLEMSASLCSSTAVGPNAILSAAHCFEDGEIEFKVDGTPVKIVTIFNDTNDHVIMKVEGVTFLHWATFGPVPTVGDEIHYWGNPTLKDLFRKGYVAGIRVNEMSQSLYDVNGFYGDSGSGVFDRVGRLVGVISALRRDNDFRLMGSFPINFTPEQLDAVGIPRVNEKQEALADVDKIMTTGKVLRLISEGKVISASNQ